jgi:hypothetical protein
MCSCFYCIHAVSVFALFTRDAVQTRRSFSCLAQAKDKSSSPSKEASKDMMSSVNSFDAEKTFKDLQEKVRCGPSLVGALPAC